MKCESVVLKIASRCNLNCTYCYMYNLEDKSYKMQPKFMSFLVVDALLHRIRNHCIANSIKSFAFVFHGGEPLLADQDYYRQFIERAFEVFKDDVDIKFQMQTNGVLIDDAWCSLFKEYNIKIGISMDGTREAHDMYRLDHKGEGSYDDVLKGINIYKKHFNEVGIITVLNYEIDPIVIYENLKEIGVKGYNILLPDFTYESRPPLITDYEDADNTPIGDWLIKLFDHWYKKDSETLIGIEYFITFINLLCGLNQYGNEAYGSKMNTVLVIETNGDIEPSDSLKACGDRFTKNNVNVIHNELDEVFTKDLSKLYYSSHDNLCDQCNACPINHICGGGYLVNRYSTKNGFNNPTVFCKDMIKIITHIQNRLFGELPASYLEEANIELLDYYQVREIIAKNLKNLNKKTNQEFLEQYKVSV